MASRTRPLARAGNVLRYRAEAARALVEKQTANIATALNPEELQTVFTALARRPLIKGYFAALRLIVGAVIHNQHPNLGFQEAWKPVRCMADDPVVGELVSPCYSLFSPVMFGKTGKFPFLWNDLRSTFFQVLSSFPFVMVFPFDTGTAIISPQNRDIFSMFQGRST